TPPRATMTVPSTYEVGDPSTSPIEGTIFSLPSTWTSCASYSDRGLVPGWAIWSINMDIAIGEIHPRVATVGEQVESRVDTYPSGQMTVPGQDVIAGSSEQVQTLQTALHEIELQNQQLRTRVAELESHMGIVMPYMLWMEERLTVLEKRLPGPPLGPQ
nr:hypothetical protein [Tanacetum cinerariifolium]